MSAASLHLSEDVARALSVATDRLLSTEAIEATLIFGSYARGTATPMSDIDVIHLLREHRSARRPLYHRMAVDGIDLDVNLVTAADVGRLIAIPSWQYRFVDACVFHVEDERRSETLGWLARVQALIQSNDARTGRMAFLRDRIAQLLARTNFWAKDRELRTFSSALALERSLFLLCESAGMVPFLARNPLETIARAGSDLSGGCEWPLPPWRLGTDEDANSECWRSLKALLRRSMVTVPGFVQGATDGRDSADVLLSICAECDAYPDVQRMHDDMGWNDSAARRWIERALELGTPSIKVPRPGLSLAKVIHRVPRAGLQRAGARHEAFDAVRRRLKFIVPTGGCLLPRCTFCRLPELASRRETIDWPNLLRIKHADVQEVAIYTDGSFFDDREMSEEDRLQVADLVREHGIASLVVESLPQLVSLQKLDKFIHRLDGRTRLTVSVGVQSSSQTVRRVILGTPTTEAAIDRFFELTSSLPFSVRVYLLYGKAMLTLEEDEDDVRRSVADIAPRLRPGDSVTVNYLNVVQDTQVDLLERAGLYVKRDLCRFRVFMQELSVGYDFKLTPGCIVVRTCSERTRADDEGCVSCLAWLAAMETMREATTCACSRTARFAFDLPWAIFGEIQGRCDFLANTWPRHRDVMCDDERKTT